MTDMRRRCGNSPDADLTDGDRQTIAEFRAYLAQRKADQLPDAAAGADPACTVCHGTGTVEVPDPGGESASTEYCHCWEQPR